MRSYQMNIRKDAVRDLNLRREKLLSALECPSDSEIPRQKIGKSIFPLVRKPSLHGYGTRGSVHCHKAGGLVPHESALERDYYRIMEWDYTVDTFVVQPFKVPYKLPSGRDSRYTPDCFVISYKFFKGRSPIYEPTAFEIKTKDGLKEEWNELKPKLRAGRSFLAEAGFRFRLLTEDRINPVFLTNINFLLQFRGPKFLLRNAEEARIVARLLDEVRGLDFDFTPRYLLAAVSDVAPRARILPWIWNLYADYVFQCDLLVPLTLDTVSWRCGEAGNGYENCGFPSDRPDWRQPENDWRR